MNYFIHKINPGGEGVCESEMLYILKKHNLVTIGFEFLAKEFNTQDYIDKTKDDIIQDFKKILEDKYDQGKNSSQPNSLFNFIYEMKKDDILVIPLSKSTTKEVKTYYIVKLKDDLLLKPNFLPNQTLGCKENIGFLRFCEILAVVKDKNIPEIFTKENHFSFTTKLMENDEFKKVTDEMIDKFDIKQLY